MMYFRNICLFELPDTTGTWRDPNHSAEWAEATGVPWLWFSRLPHCSVIHFL